MCGVRIDFDSFLLLRFLFVRGSSLYEVLDE